MKYAFALLCLASCATPEQRLRSLASVRVEAGVGDSNEDRMGKRSWEGDSSWVAVSWAPFVGLEPPHQVVVVERPR